VTHPRREFAAATAEPAPRPEPCCGTGASEVAEEAPADAASSARPGRARLADALGPGLLTGASDDDPSGIATYSQAGAQFGLGFTWTLLFTYPLMFAIQLISAEIGRATGRGIAGNMRRLYPSPLVLVLVWLLFIANTINIGANLGAMSAALRLLVDGPAWLFVAAFALLSVGLEVFLSYERYVGVLRWLVLSLLAYAATALVVERDWGEVAVSLVVPRIEVSAEYLTVLVALFGTTISPYLFFWQAEDEVEEQQRDPAARPLTAAPEQAPAALSRIRLDTAVGMGISNLVALFIIVTTAATLHANGVTDIQSSAQAAQALRPIAGPLAFTIFAVGIIGTGLLSLPVLAGSAAYALGETLRWPVGLARPPSRARRFYASIALATLAGAALNFTPIDPIKALFWSAVINGVAAVPIMVMIMLMAARRDLMGPWALGPWLRIFGWLATAAMLAAALAMVGSWMA
jgi:NRAMP (natural resistance-associated macrophage protein)-like metal ion transporter